MVIFLLLIKSGVLGPAFQSISDPNLNLGQCKYNIIKATDFPWVVLMQLCTQSLVSIKLVPDILVRIRICGSVSLSYGTGSADPYHCLTDSDPTPDPAFLSVTDKVPTK